MNASIFPGDRFGEAQLILGFIEGCASKVGTTDVADPQKVDDKIGFLHPLRPRMNAFLLLWYQESALSSFISDYIGDDEIDRLVS